MCGNPLVVPSFLYVVSDSWQIHWHHLHTVSDEGSPFATRPCSRSAAKTAWHSDRPISRTALNTTVHHGEEKNVGMKKTSEYQPYYVDPRAIEVGRPRYVRDSSRQSNPITFSNFDRSDYPIKFLLVPAATQRHDSDHWCGNGLQTVSV